jgi:hypothetical protein
MVPRLPHSKLYFIRDMIRSQSLAAEMVEQTKCSKHKFKNIREN